MSAASSDPNPTRARRAAQAEATKEALVAAARKLFVTKGFDDTSTDEIVAAAGVGTRGALYHHFADKKALFEAVVLDIEQELLRNVAAEFTVTDNAGAFDLLQQEAHAFLRACLSPDVQRILLIDGRAVLGWQRWREIESRHGVTVMRALLEQASKDGDLAAGVPIDVLANILLAALDEAALFIATSGGSTAAHDEAVAGMNVILDGLRTRPSG
ncbi:TetR/AcrR family transcriptional regulator [Aldersonia kunmingensis]|uniref:TetR/AcrR family transcriptional regulator n=1 Tax=Aldersonia kunmingensis TaxID=408066 RepID=UPI0008367B7B|nr:TetR/AcrR family transcriptional regulator [Aldersonia kunmingensis]